MTTLKRSALKCLWILAAIVPSSVAFCEVQDLRRTTRSIHSFGYSAIFREKIPQVSVSASPSSGPEFSELSSALLDESTKDLLADEVLGLIEIPLVPEPIVKFIVDWAIKGMASNLSPGTMLRLNVMLEAEKTVSESDDSSSDNRDALANDIADELSAKLDVPILSEEQEVETLRSIVRTALAVLTTSAEEFKEARFAFELNAARDLLCGEDGRLKLAEILNAQIDVPFLGEAEEQALLMKLLSDCADVLQSLLPPELVIRLRGESTEGLKEIKEHLVSRIDDRVDLGIVVPREKKLWVIGKVVDSIIDLIVGDTEVELFLMDVEERRSKLLKIRKSLEYEIDMNKRAFDKQQEAMKDQVDRINRRLKELEF